MSSLVEIEVEGLPTLRDKFLADWPTHIIAYSLLDSFIKRFQRKKNRCANIKIFSLNDEWKSDGTFIALMVRERENIS